MKTLFQSLFQKLVSALSDRLDRALETMALRDQLAVLERSAKRPHSRMSIGACGSYWQPCGHESRKLWQSCKRTQCDAEADRGTALPEAAERAAAAREACHGRGALLQVTA